MLLERAVAGTKLPLPARPERAFDRNRLDTGAGYAQTPAYVGGQATASFWHPEMLNMSIYGMSMMECHVRTLAAYRPALRPGQAVIPPIEWPVFADDIDAILALKRERNAVILAHNYQTPEIFHCVADIVGDSLALAREAMKADADVIVLAGVHFMAETAKLLNPGKTVLIPDLARRLLARRIDHRRGRAPAARSAIPACPS